MLELLFLVVVVTVIAAVVMGFFLSIRAFLERRRAFWRKRLYGREEAEAPTLLGAELQPKPPTGWSDRLDRDFARLVDQTGIRWTSEQTLGAIALLTVVLAGAMLLWRGDLWLVTAGLVVGIALPLAVLAILRRRWRNGLQAQLPDAFFLLARSLRAGESLEQAFETVATHGTRPLAGEFRHGVEKIKLGLAVPAALRGMSRRLELTDFDVFVAAVTLHRTVGGNLTVLLDRVASSTRDRNLFRGYVLAATALSRITGFSIAIAAPVLFLGYLILQPEYVANFTQSPAGMRALWMAIGLELIGAVWMYYLLRIDY